MVLPASAIDFPPVDRRGGDAGAQVASAIECAQCGASFELPPQGDTAITAACLHCDALLELDEAGSRVLQRSQDKPDLVLEVGDSGALLGKDYTVVGRMLYREDHQWLTSEFLLWRPDSGYLWLEYSDRHFAASSSPTISRTS